MSLDEDLAARAALVRTFRDGSARVETLAGQAASLLYASWPETDEDLAANDLLAELLVSVPIYPLWLERKLIALRRRFLFEGVGDRLTPFLANLAIQCFLNEYAWAVEAPEQERVETLIAGAEGLGPSEIMILACYTPLSSVPGADAWRQKTWLGPVRAVLQEQIVAVRQEQAIGAQLPLITPLGSGVSQHVRAQYEENPYPRWRRVTPMPAQASVFGWPVPARAEVLFAGCGTGYHAIHAGQRYAGARVLAVDLSRASLGYAKRKAQDAGIENMEFAQADLLQLASIDRTFDVIECSGVLHHLADPFEGAKVLAGILRPGGAMKLGLYSAAARANLQPAKALARSYAPETIRRLRQAIIAAPQGDPVKAPMRFTDFYSTSALRDLLMHVQEHELEVGDIRRMLEENGLRLLAFAISEETKTAYREQFPDDPGATDLAHWAEFERARPDTFRGMYQFWVDKPR